MDFPLWKKQYLKMCSLSYTGLFLLQYVPVWHTGTFFQGKKQINFYM